MVAAKDSGQTGRRQSCGGGGTGGPSAFHSGAGTYCDLRGVGKTCLSVASAHFVPSRCVTISTHPLFVSPQLTHNTYPLTDVKDETINLSDTTLTFKGKSGDKDYEVNIEFFKAVDAKDSTYKVLPRSIQMHVMKAKPEDDEDEEFWPRLLKDKALEKNQVKIDWDRYVDEDEEEEAGGFDTSALEGGMGMGGMPGMGGMGGMMGGAGGGMGDLASMMQGMGGGGPGGGMDMEALMKQMGDLGGAAGGAGAGAGDDDDSDDSDDDSLPDLEEN